MKILLKNIEQFILSNTAWAFASGILFTSTIMVFLEGRQEWAVYLAYVGKTGLLFAPVLAFAGFREQLQERLSLPAFILLWAFCFLAYPWLTELSGGYRFIDASDKGLVAVRSTGAWFLATELAIQLNNFWLGRKRLRRWAERISLEQGILLLTAVFALFFAGLSYSVPGNPIREASASKLAGFIIQIYIILLIYYCFYWVNHYFLINKVLRRKGAVIYGLALIATVVAFYPIAAQLIYWLPITRQTEIHPVNNGQIFGEINAFIPLLGMLFSIPFILAIKWFRQNNEIAALAREKAETELSLLKQQINPHFFFNTLNNLYALSLTQDKQTPEAIMQLSELMRYVIYKGKEDSVRLEEEVNYLEDYVRIQQIRLHKQLDFRIAKEISDGQIPVPPLLFIPLVENAFKHGIEPAEKACFLYIHLKSGPDGLEFCCENSLEGKAAGHRGIGLDNIRRRLQLRFPGRHELRVEEKRDSFKATLKLAYGQTAFSDH